MKTLTVPEIVSFIYCATPSFVRPLPLHGAQPNAVAKLKSMTTNILQSHFIIIQLIGRPWLLDEYYLNVSDDICLFQPKYIKYRCLKKMYQI